MKMKDEGLRVPSPGFASLNSSQQHDNSISSLSSLPVPSLPSQSSDGSLPNDESYSIPMCNEATASTGQEWENFFDCELDPLFNLGADEDELTTYDTEHLATYQGRVDLRSVNGCAVIASLVCFMHLAFQHMANKVIHDVIDNLCGPILERIRAATKCDPGEAVIACDANDHIWSSCRYLLRFPLQQKVVEGNCSLISAVERFVATLVSIPGKASAAFCAFGHVIAILKDGFRFEWVDSMPGSQGFATRVRFEGDLEPYLLEYIRTKNLQGTPQMFQAFIWARKQEERASDLHYLFSSIGSGKTVHPTEAWNKKRKNHQKPPPPRDGRYEYIAPENRHIKCGRGNYKHPGNRALNEACVARCGQNPQTPTERQATAIAVFRQMQEDGRLFIAEWTKTKKWYIVSDEFAQDSIDEKVRQHYRPNRQ